MKTKLSTQNKVLLFLALVAIAAVVGSQVYSKNKQKSSDSVATPGDQQSYTPPEKTDDPNSEANQEREVIQQEGSLPTTSTLKAFITRAGQIDSEIQVRATVTGTTQGSCLLTLKGPADQTVTKTTAVQVERAAAMCSPLNISVAELESGSWTAELVVKNGSNTSSAATTQVVVKK